MTKIRKEIKEILFYELKNQMEHVGDIPLTYRMFISTVTSLKIFLFIRRPVFMPPDVFHDDIWIVERRTTQGIGEESMYRNEYEQVCTWAEGMHVILEFPAGRELRISVLCNLLQ